MTKRDDIRDEQHGPTGEPGLEEREALAARVDDDPAGDATLDERSRRTVAQLRELRAALHDAGPARVSDGFAERVLARLAQPETPVVQLAPRARIRRASVTIILQAASLVALLFTYGALLAATRVHDVGPRWEESDDSDPPAARAGLEPASGAAPAPASTPALGDVRVTSPTARSARVAQAAEPAPRKPSIPLLPPRCGSV
jgi:hypothetical protein